MEKILFWISIIIILISGTLGVSLFKYGLNLIGDVGFKNLVEMKIGITEIAFLIIMCVGVCLTLVGGLNLRSIFIFKYLFNPIIIVALLLMFLSRILMGIPLSSTGLGRFYAIFTPLMIALTALISSIFFQEKFNLKLILGICLGMVAVFIIENS